MSQRQIYVNNQDDVVLEPGEKIVSTRVVKQEVKVQRDYNPVFKELGKFGKNIKKGWKNLFKTKTIVSKKGAKSKKGPPPPPSRKGGKGNKLISSASDPDDRQEKRNLFQQSAFQSQQYMNNQVLENEKIEFDDGAEYIGEVLVKVGKFEDITHLMHGRGVWKHSSGQKYEGMWKNNQKDGKGKEYFANGNIYEGPFKRNLPNGVGTYILTDGSKYVGDVVDGRYKGKGKVYDKKGRLVYDGEYANNLRNGIGVYYYSNGNEYTGRFVNNKRVGRGKLVFASGTEYLGEFKNDKQEGIGVMVYSNGAQWIGTFKNNKQDKEYMRVILERLRLTKYHAKCVEKGFSLGMMRELESEDFEILLEIIFPEQRIRERVQAELKKEYQNVMKIMKDVKQE